MTALLWIRSRGGLKDFISLAAATSQDNILHTWVRSGGPLSPSGRQGFSLNLRDLKIPPIFLSKTLRQPFPVQLAPIQFWFELFLVFLSLPLQSCFNLFRLFILDSIICKCNASTFTATMRPSQCYFGFIVITDNLNAAPWVVDGNTDPLRWLAAFWTSISKVLWSVTTYLSSGMSAATDHLRSPICALVWKFDKLQKPQNLFGIRAKWKKNLLPNMTLIVTTWFFATFSLPSDHCVPVLRLLKSWEPETGENLLSHAIYLKPTRFEGFKMFDDWPLKKK